MTWSADGDKHDRRCIVVALALGGGIAALGHPVLGLKAGITITTWGLLFSPDLDLSNTGRHQGGGCKAWHRWKRMRLGWFWKPYGYLIPHRSEFSHTLIPGTLLRLLYVLIVPGLLWLWQSDFDFSTLIKEIEPLSAEQLKAQKDFVLYALFYLSCCFTADAVHLWTDNIPFKKWIA